MIAKLLDTPIALPESTDVQKPTKAKSGFADALTGLLNRKTHIDDEDEELTLVAPQQLVLDIKSIIARAQVNAQARTETVGAFLVNKVMTNAAQVEPELSHAIEESFRDDAAALTHESVLAKTDTPVKVETPEAPRPVFKSELVDAIAKHVVRETPKVEIVVQPPELGRVHVSVEVRQNEVHVRVNAENQDVAKNLSERLPELQQTLRDQGMRIGSIDVGMQTTSGEAGDFSHSSGGGFERQDRDSEPRHTPQPATPKTSARIGKRKLDIVA